jgi:putative methyltransferase
MEAAGIDKQQHAYKPWLIKVLVYELLLGKKKITGGGAGPRLVKACKEKLTEALDKILQRQGVTSVIGLLPASQRESFALPKYARVNTFKTSVDKVRASLTESGWREEPHEDFLRAIDAEAQHAGANGHAGARDKHQYQRIFALDKDLHDVIMLPPGAQLAHDDPLLVSCQLRLQDKASCLPAHVLTSGRRPLTLTLDACAAPGNKTTHLAALLYSDRRHPASSQSTSTRAGGVAAGRGKVMALDVDKKRCALLQETVTMMGAGQSVSVLHQDFLKIDPRKAPFCDVQGIMLDPSCSGSGIRGRAEREQDDCDTSDVRQRLLNLAAFQTKALAHALSFPSVERVVYSTCSVHREENEDVVQTCLAAAAGKRFRLERALPHWARRGVGAFEGAECCVRVAREDRAMGFFLACLVRTDVYEDAADGDCNGVGGGGAGEGVGGGAVTHRRTAAQDAAQAGGDVVCGGRGGVRGAGAGARGEGGRGAPPARRRGAGLGLSRGPKLRGRGGLRVGVMMNRLLSGGFGRSAFY